MEKEKAAESSKKCSNILKTNYERHIGKDIKRFLKPGGYKEYKQLIEKVIDDYEKETKSEIMANEIKKKFLDEQKLEENRFLGAQKDGGKIEEKEQELIQKIHQYLISQGEEKSKTSYLRTGFIVVSAGITCVGLATVSSPALAAVGVGALAYKGYKLFRIFSSK